MAYQQAMPLGAGMSGKQIPISQAGGAQPVRSSQPAPAHSLNPHAYVSSQPMHYARTFSVAKRFTAEDYRREIARVRRSRKRKIIAVVACVLLAAAIACFILVAGARTLAVADASMEPAVSQGQTIIMVNANNPYVGAVVAYQDNAGDTHLGRVIAEPGDWVNVAADGVVAVSEERLSSKTAQNVFGTNAGTMVSRQVPEGLYYVLGDAEQATATGLTDKGDFVPGDQIVGRALAKVWPITSLGLVS